CSSDLSSSPPRAATAPRPSCPRSSPTDPHRPARPDLTLRSSETGEGPDLGSSGGGEGDGEGGDGESVPQADALASGPVAGDDVSAASAWAAAIKEQGDRKSVV